MDMPICVSCSAILTFRGHAFVLVESESDFLTSIWNAARWECLMCNSGFLSCGPNPIARKSHNTKYTERDGSKKVVNYEEKIKKLFEETPDALVYNISLKNDFLKKLSEIENGYKDE